MNTLQADAALQNIFAACKQTPPTASVDAITRQLKHHSRVYGFLLMLTTALLLITFLAPLFIVPAAYLW